MEPLLSTNSFSMEVQCCVISYYQLFCFIDNLVTYKGDERKSKCNVHIISSCKTIYSPYDKFKCFADQKIYEFRKSIKIGSGGVSNCFQ